MGADSQSAFRSVVEHAASDDVVAVSRLAAFQRMVISFSRCLWLPYSIPGYIDCQGVSKRQSDKRAVFGYNHRMAIFTVDDTGVHVPSLETALAATRQQMADIFGDDLAGDAQTPQGQLAGIIAILEAAIGEALVQLGNATSVDDAVGTQLDTLGELLDILRQRATRSR